MSTYGQPNRLVLRPPIEPRQFASWAFTDRATASGLVPSMGSVGDCYDNSKSESFWSWKQVELLDRKKWKDPCPARERDP